LEQLLLEHAQTIRTAPLQVRTILSQNTTDTNSGRAFSQLKAAFPTWESVRTASEGKHACVQSIIHVGPAGAED